MMNLTLYSKLFVKVNWTCNRCQLEHPDQIGIIALQQPQDTGVPSADCREQNSLLPSGTGTVEMQLCCR